jgi:hypothetical protein
MSIANDFHYKEMRNGSSGGHQPLPETDALGMFKDKGFEDYRFGFRTIGQIRDWWPAKPYRRSMNDVGIRMHVYKVRMAHIEFGAYQVLFNVTKAELIETRDVPA